ncbi:MAG: hypothetical protein ACYTED_20420 [Planctomycetota bacterium]
MAFGLQLALIRDAPALLSLVLPAIGLCKDEQELDGRAREVWFEIPLDADDQAIDEARLAIAQQALDDRCRKYGDRIRDISTAWKGLALTLQLDRIHRNSELRERVLPALDFYLHTIEVDGEKRDVWLLWGPGDPPTAFHSHL